MKRTEWFIAIFLVIIGLSCLTTSATFLVNPDSIRAYLRTLLQICLWIGIPLAVGILVYLLVKRGSKANENNEKE
jgi:hypothetical protein